MTYNLNGKIIEIKIIRKKNKNIYLRFENSNIINVTCNSWIKEKEIYQILQKNEKSLEKMLQKKINEEQFADTFQYLGKKYTIILDETTTAPFFGVNTINAKDEKMIQKFYQKECQRIFKEEIKRILPYFPSIPKFELKIRKMKTRWGVNNFSSHTITLNSELLKKDLELIDYVIIHELCHFYEPNHSSKFWAHVEEYYPKYKEARKRLRGEI